MRRGIKIDSDWSDIAVWLFLSLVVGVRIVYHSYRLFSPDVQAIGTLTFLLVFTAYIAFVVVFTDWLVRLGACALCVGLLLRAILQFVPQVQQKAHLLGPGSHLFYVAGYLLILVYLVRAASGKVKIVEAPHNA